MRTVLLPLHLACVGLWLGCVLTEALFERALIGRGRESERILAALHTRVDALVEIPAFTLVVITGSLLLSAAAPSGLLHAKLGLAALAVLANVWCVHLVFKRDRLARAGDWAAFEAVDHLQHKVGAVVLVGLLGALGIGLSLYSAGPGG